MSVKRTEGGRPLGTQILSELAEPLHPPLSPAGTSPPQGGRRECAERTARRRSSKRSRYSAGTGIAAGAALPVSVDALVFFGGRIRKNKA
ncbi:hypothetical protein CLV41_1116 [Roseibium marinum]|uniref:Uncharacterized protein n=1 Tax=Roseibium marinum TaxID=281252 RepID=A0A2S3UM31_9HYPH|nr:hypothetical protein CLV41_1116 [Roseibium marinum]